MTFRLWRCFEIEPQVSNRWTCCQISGKLDFSFWNWAWSFSSGLLHNFFSLSQLIKTQNMDKYTFVISTNMFPIWTNIFSIWTDAGLLQMLCIHSLMLFKCGIISSTYQGGTICGTIEGSSRSLKSIDKCVFINFRDKYAVFKNFRDKNAVFTSFRDKNYVFELRDKNTVFGFNFVCSG